MAARRLRHARGLDLDLRSGRHITHAREEARTGGATPSAHSTKALASLEGGLIAAPVPGAQRSEWYTSIEYGSDPDCYGTCENPSVLRSEALAIHPRRSKGKRLTPFMSG